MTNKLVHKAIQEQFSGQHAISKLALTEFLRLHYGEEVKPSTLAWRLHELTQAGILIRTGYGYYDLNDRPTFLPTLSPMLRKINERITAELPFTDCCVWDTRILTNLMVQQPMSYLQLVEVDRVALSSVYQLLQARPVLVDRKAPAIYLYEDWLTLSRNGVQHPAPVILKPLISEAPLQPLDRYVTAPLEKILVDLLADQPLFFAYQEELDHIVRTAFDKFIINRDKLRRYARRRNRIEQVDQLLRQLPTTQQYHDS